MTSKLIQTRLILNGMSIPRGVLPNDEIWLLEKQVLLRQTNDDKLSAFVVNEEQDESYATEKAKGKILPYLVLCSLLTNRTATMEILGHVQSNL